MGAFRLTSKDDVGVASAPAHGVGGSPGPHLGAPKFDFEAMVDPWPPGYWTLAQARDFVRTNRDQGVDCPCCTRFVKVYARTLNATTVRSLCWIVRAHAGDLVDTGFGDKRVIPKVNGNWVDVPEFAPAWVVRTNQHASLKWWHLAEPGPNDVDKDTRDSGLWRPTRLGVDFAHGRVQVPRKVFTFLGNVLGYGEEMGDLMDALGESFSFREVMETDAPASPAGYAPFTWRVYGEPVAVSPSPRPFALVPKEGEA